MFFDNVSFRNIESFVREGNFYRRRERVKVSQEKIKIERNW